jgi:ABC-type transporter Mla subunit MlaD
MKRLDAATIKAVADQIRAALGDDFDDSAFWDTLDGETDAGDLLDHLIWQAQSTQTLVDSLKEHEGALKARRDRLERRIDACKAAMLSIIASAGVKRVERPCATLTLRNGSPSVVVTDEDALPSQLCTFRKVPDKKAIKAQLDAGETVPGAEIKIGPDGLTMRTA